MPRAREHTTKYFTLSYHNPESGEYGLGGKDGYLILFFIVLFTGLRAAAMEYILAPFARSWGISKRKDVTRFSEQAWLLVYYTVFWPLGMVRLLLLQPRTFLVETANLTLCSTFTAIRLRI